MSLEITLCDQDVAVIRAWEQEFAGCDDVQVRWVDFFDVQADAYVSPANSFGVMDGGIDLALRDYFGFQLQERVQEAIAQFGPRLPVGEALVVETGDSDIPYLVVAPTMELPSNVSMTDNAYEAMGAVLAAVQRFNEENPGAIQAIAIPGLCTGIGSMDPEVSAAQMRRAYSQYLDSPGI